ncbi:MAG: hypothetical protein JSR67_03655 [Proteobacteria bacterium]|nr:hypothetical protein [Pseudomonadota bacterium]
MRELAGYDVDRMRQVVRWPLRDALLAYQHMRRDSAREQYLHDVRVWASIAPHSAKKIDPPKVPAILKGHS